MQAHRLRFRIRLTGHLESLTGKLPYFIQTLTHGDAVAD